MKYKATTSFCGAGFSVQQGQVLTLTDQALINDWMQAGYIVEFDDTLPSGDDYCTADEVNRMIDARFVLA